jgi:hypothetical protein
MHPGRRAAVALAAWTLVIWAGRVRNVLADGGAAGDLIVPAGLLVLAVVALVAPRRAWILAAVTIGVWAVRLPLVLAHDHAAGFKIVHTVLAAVSIALAVWALRSARRRELTTLATR